MNISRIRTLPFNPGNPQHRGELVSECFKNFSTTQGTGRGTRDPGKEKINDFEELLVFNQTQS